MDATKLTLSIPGKLLVDAKAYSQKTHQPLSRLVSHYFSVLVQALRSKESQMPISAKVRTATGIVQSKKEEDKLLFEALQEKYK